MEIEDKKVEETQQQQQVAEQPSEIPATNEIQENPQQNGENQETQNVEAIQEEPQEPKPHVPHLPQRKFEVTSQYKQRQKVYEKVYIDLKDYNKAVCYSNIFSNIKFLQNKYEEGLTRNVMAYAEGIEV